MIGNGRTVRVVGDVRRQVRREVVGGEKVKARGNRRAEGGGVKGWGVRTRVRE